MRKSLLCRMLVLTLCLIPGMAWGGFEEEVGEDLAVREAYLVAPAGQMWLLDIDASAGVQVGDLFTVVEKGAPVVHPVTGETIGNLDEVIGVLQVTKVKQGYSYAAVLNAEKPLEPSLKVKRYANLPATFWDYTGRGEAVFADLQAAMPELDWVSYAMAQQTRPETPAPLPGMPAGLVFVLTDQGLAVKDNQFQPIRFYRPAELAATAAAPAATSAPATASSVPAPRAEGIVAPRQDRTVAGDAGGKSFFGGLFSTGSRQRSNAPSATQVQRGGLIVSQMDKRQGVWYGPRMKGHPIGIEVGDFTGDGANEVALCYREKLILARVVNEEFSPLATYEFGAAGDALSLDGLDLDHDGRLELYISRYAMNALRSSVYELQSGKLVEIIDDVPWFLRKVALGDEGYVLLGQNLNDDLLAHENDLAGPIFKVYRAGGELQRGEELNLPDKVSLYGFLPFESNGRPLLANLNNSDKLQVLEMGGATIWESYDYFGGSETSFERPDGTYEAGTRYGFLKARIEPGPDGTLLVPVNEGSRTFGAFMEFRSSYLVALEFDGYTLSERWRTKPQGGYMADFSIADADNDEVDEIVMLVKFSGGGFLEPEYGNTAMLIYEMQ